MLFTILSVAAGVLSGVVLALKVIAPRTSNTVDDSVLKRLEQLEDLMKLLPGGKTLVPAPAPEPEPAPVPPAE